MDRTSRTHLLLGLLGLVLMLLSVLAPRAGGHATGQEVKAREGCAALSARSKDLVEHCERCLARARPHHFHPEYPPGERCRPDDGRP